MFFILGLQILDGTLIWRTGALNTVENEGEEGRASHAGEGHVTERRVRPSTDESVTNGCDVVEELRR